MLSLYQLFRDFENFLHVSIWVLPILGAHPFSRSDLPKMQPWINVTTVFIKLFTTNKTSLILTGLNIHQIINSDWLQSS